MIETKVREVKIYRRGAMVTKTGEVEFKQGSQTIQIGWIPADVDQSTIRLMLPEGISGTNVQVKNVTDEEREEYVSVAEDLVSDLQGEIEIRQKQMDMWNVNADFSSRQSVSIAEMSEYIEKLPQRLDTLKKEIRELNKKLTKARKDLNDRRKAIARYVVWADVDVPYDGKCEVGVRFYANNVCWNPKYELHTNEDNSEITILLKAKARQNTGEDWDGVKVVLYSGNPSLGGTIPEIGTQYLDYYVARKAAPRYAGGAVGGSMKAAMMSFATVEDDLLEEECEAAEEPVMDTAYAQTASYDVFSGGASANKGDAMMEYELNGVWDINQRDEMSCDLTKETINCRYHAVCVPKLDESTYLAAEVKTADIESLMDTSADVYHNGTYMGAVYLSPDMTKDNYDLSLGKDESIKVKRTQLKRETSNVLLKGQKKTEMEYEITVTSNKAKTFPVTVIDQVPVSVDKSIVVDVKEISGAELKEKAGRVTWDFDMNPGDSKKLKLAYSVAWPKDKTVIL